VEGLRHEALPQSGEPVLFEFGSGPLGELRTFVSRLAVAAGLGPGRTEDIVLVVNEIASNSLLHGGGRGTLRVWQDGDSFVCEIHDTGHFDHPRAGRRAVPPEPPALDQDGGRGLWLANQLCDLVQVRSLPSGTVVRLHTRLR